MPLTAYVPLDPHHYGRHEERAPFSADVAPGAYVYVQDCSGVVWLSPDGPHVHPRVLGGARPVVAAGELILGENGEVLSINNLSGTFRCAADCLLVVVGGIVVQGGKIEAGAVTRYEV
jgi:hypothetical protein